MRNIALYSVTAFREKQNNNQVSAWSDQYDSNCLHLPTEVQKLSLLYERSPMPPVITIAVIVESVAVKVVVGSVVIVLEESEIRFL